MYISTPTPFLLSLLTTLISATPLPLNSRAMLMGSSKNVYLTTCTTRSVISDTTSSSAILYAGTPASTSPVAIGTVASVRAIQWAGFTRRVTLDNTAVFESRIERGADAWPKNEIAGGATLEASSAGPKEEFVCFRDGETTFRFVGGLLGEETTVCKTEFWCASLAV